LTTAGVRGQLPAIVNRAASIQAYATCVDINGAGVLLRGPSGSGKSDLALRLIEGGAKLVADDRTDLSLENGRLMARAPQSIAGRMEVRGLGIITVAYCETTEVALVVDLVAPDAVDRLPDSQCCTYLEHGVPLLALAAFEASTPAKIRLAVQAAKQGQLFAA
jgi:serine kinase of HPr protein (carbohydrate metabolism regulator)